MCVSVGSCAHLFVVLCVFVWVRHEQMYMLTVVFVSAYKTIIYLGTICGHCQDVGTCVAKVYKQLTQYNEHLLPGSRPGGCLWSGLLGPRKSF